MSLLNILVLIAAAVVIRLAFPGKLRKWALLAVSTVAIYWLQPALPIRNLDFWFPTATLGLVFLSWSLTAEKAQLKDKNNWLAAGLAVLTLVIIALTRLVSLQGILTATRPPQFIQVCIGLGLIMTLTYLFARFFKPSKTVLIGGVFFLLLIFLFTKNPLLSTQASQVLRRLTAQNPALAKSTDLGWLGYSYVAFRLIHTLIDRYHGRLKDIQLGEYLVYTIFFPAFLAGPLDRLQNFRKDLNNPLPLNNEELLTSGKRITIGLFRKFIIADSLAFIAISGNKVPQVRSALWLWVMLIAYAFQIYFDFSGYTDIAIGMGALLGFKLPENFNKPYRQPNLTLFWNNWHMSLTQWFRGYLFNPLTRSLRKGKKLSIPVIILITQLTTFIVIGLWHGITINFVIWGAWHGIGIFIHNRWSGFANPRVIELSDKQPFLGKLFKYSGIIGTFLFVSLGWIWFALPTTSLAVETFLKLFTGS
jgi:D-alanyl-lipoteichoic acid acyltransferase DltB (MBOAT superfamily)